MKSLVLLPIVYVSLQFLIGCSGKSYINNFKDAKETCEQACKIVGMTCFSFDTEIRTGKLLGVHCE